jgi:hypothetical protein
MHSRSTLISEQTGVRPVFMGPGKLVLYLENSYKMDERSEDARNNPNIVKAASRIDNFSLCCSEVQATLKYVRIYHKVGLPKEQSTPPEKPAVADCLRPQLGELPCFNAIK